MVGTLAPPPYNADHIKPQRHNEYYLDNGDLVIQIQNTLFRVWSTSFRRHSVTFEELLRPPKISKNRRKSIEDGRDDEHPLHLDDNDVEASSFEYLLWIIYPPVFGQYKANNVPQWVAILDLSTRWDFMDIRKLALSELNKLEIEPIEKIVLEHKYKIERQWAYTSYIELCSRRSPLTKEDAAHLGIETSTLINEARERLEKSGRSQPKLVARMVCELFDLTDPARGSCTVQ